MMDGGGIKLEMCRREPWKVGGDKKTKVMPSNPVTDDAYTWFYSLSSCLPFFLPSSPEHLVPIYSLSISGAFSQFRLTYSLLHKDKKSVHPSIALIAINQTN